MQSCATIQGYTLSIQILRPVLTRMSALWQTHMVAHSQTPFPPLLIMNMDIFPVNGWICFRLSPSGGFSDDLSAEKPRSVFHKMVFLLLHFPLAHFLVLPSAVMRVTNHRFEAFLMLFCTSSHEFIFGYIENTQYGML